MALPFLDDFNRADGGLGANWTTLDPTINVSSNRAAATDAASSAYYNGDTPNADCYVQAKFYLPTGGTEALGLVARFNTATFNGYLCRFVFGTGMQIGRLDTGVITVLATMGAAPTTGQTVRFELSGSNLELFYDGVSAGSTTDATYGAAARSGLVASSSGAAGTLDDFETGNLAGATFLPRGMLLGAG